MIAAHLLTAALLFNCVYLFAQEQIVKSPDTNRNILQIIPTDNSHIFVGNGRPLGFGLPLSGDTLCYKMRSNVVARDRKDSDSVHPASYSTCQLASRYRLRKTQMRTNSSSR